MGLDVGTTGVKAVAFAPGSSWRVMALREYPLLHPAPGQEVQDPGVVVEAACAALAECTAKLDGARVLAISLSAAMHALMALDRHRRPLTPLVTWADGRASEEAATLLGSGRAGDLQGSTGTPIHPMAPLSKLLWFSRHDPETWAAARWWVGMKEVLVMWLTGALVTEVSSASGTGLLDARAGTWSPLALEVCGLDRAKLPEILPVTSALPLRGEAAAQVGLAEGTPVVLGAADGPLANLGVGAIGPGVAGLSLGTSGAIRITVEGPHPDPRGRLFCYALAGSFWIVGGATSNGANVARWTGGALLPEVEATADPDAAVLKLAASVEAGSEGLVMLPHLFPERPPLWDPRLAGAYLGISSHHTRAHLTRAAIEGVCLQMRVILDRLDALYPVTSIRATGGALRSPLWRELLAGALDQPLWVVEEAAGSALGAAALGMLAVRKAAGLEEALESLAGKVAGAQIEPTPQSVRLFEELRSRVPQLLDALTRAARDWPLAEELRAGKPQQSPRRS